jgi:gliding motility-associated-like protein
MVIYYLSIGQPGTGLPVWVISPVSDSGVLTVNWKTTPPEVKVVPELSPSERATASTAVNKCGEPVFHVIHTGLTNTPDNLFIYDLDGNALLNNEMSNGPGLNSKRVSGELQIVNVPGSNHEWYIIYQEWMTNNGAPLNDGDYSPARTLYSRISYGCDSILVLERDIPLIVAGTAYTYTNGKAISFLPGNPDQLCLYAVRRGAGNSYLSVDRFLITQDGIEFAKNTGNINTDNWNLTIASSPIEVSSDGLRIAVNNRDQSTNGDTFFIFDALAFNNNPGNYQSISLGDLILQPDNVIVFTAAPVSSIAMNNPSLYFLVNMESKISEIELSPNGQYLYFANGGFAGGGLTNTTYLGQIDLGPINNPASYPYNLRLQIQKPPGIFDPYEGSGGMESQYPDTYYPVWVIEKSYNDAMYFFKRNSPYLYSVPFPDQQMPQCLVPSDIDLSDASHPNITLYGKIWLLPDQIDGYDYETAINPAINLGNDTIICEGNQIALTPGGQFESYCWQDGSSEPVFYASETGTYFVEVIDEFGCFAYDTLQLTISSEVAGSLGDDKTLCPGDSVLITPGEGFTEYLWQDGSTNSDFLAKDSGTYWVEVNVDGGCKVRDSIEITLSLLPVADMGPDTIICDGDFVMLNPGDGFIQYLWQDGSEGQEFTTGQSGLYWVEAKNSNGCKSRDSIFIDVALLPEVDLGHDTTLNDGDVINLDAGSGFISYLWKDGSTGRFFEADKQAYYWVIVSDGLCEASDTILITYNDCEANLVIPNCFTPNGDGFNERFNVESGNIISFSMLIFNRWGQKLFETKDISYGWDGKVSGRLCPVGTYFYLIEFSYECSSGIIKTEEKTGSITLLE